MLRQEISGKWALLEIALLGFCMLGADTEAHILIYRRTTNQLLEEYNDLPALFGASLPANGLRIYVVARDLNDTACNPHQLPPLPSHDITYPKGAKFGAIVQRGGGLNCTFELKVRLAQEAHFNAVIVYNNDSDDLEQMSAQNASGINIPAVFVGHTTGLSLKSFVVSDFVIVINDELPFNINTQLILPFSILIGLCFLIMIFYMIYKCIREERRLRRYRLPKSMLKKLPILKYTKSSDPGYETCVICLDDFVEGDKLRILPCRHPYHTQCIDPWLTENSRLCPICKRKVFTKGEARSRRNRQSSLDSVTDTDDDTTPLLQPSANANASRDGNVATRHGTFRRDTTTASEATSSDDENLILTQNAQPQGTQRVNPFDRAPNLPPHLAEQLSRNSRSIWSYPILRLFRRSNNISVVAPPFLEDALPDAGQHDDDSNMTRTVALPRSINAAGPAADTLVGSAHSSNNILNPNLSGSFKVDDDDLPHQSIYEPIAVATPTTITATNPTTTSHARQNDGDSVFIQTPTQNGIAVCALPNTSTGIDGHARNVRRADGENLGNPYLI